MVPHCTVMIQKCMENMKKYPDIIQKSVAIDSWSGHPSIIEVILYFIA